MGRYACKWLILKEDPAAYAQTHRFYAQSHPCRWLTDDNKLLILKHIDESCETSTRLYGLWFYGLWPNHEGL